MLKGIMDKLTETGRYYGMEMNVEKTKVMRISRRQPHPVTTTIDQKQLENVKRFKYLGSMLTDDGKGTCEIKSRIAMAKAAFNRKEEYFYQQIGLKFEEDISEMLSLGHGSVSC